MEWTREMRYRKIEEVSEENYQKLLQDTAGARWRQRYHIQPPTGLLNDPNGFVYHNGLYHLFYQWFPLGEVHGIKYWYHLTSEDLVDFTELGAAISPDTLYDSHGAYSGSGIVVDDEIKLVYTGNHRTSEWERIPYQLTAALHGNTVQKNRPFIEGAPDGYTEHFRDPKVWQEDETYYAVIGAQRLDETGTIVVYESNDFIDWTMKGEIQTNYQSFGYMWECPDYFRLDDRDVVLFCPQGVEAQGMKYQNIYQSGYITGQLDKDRLCMAHGEFIELDRGFDFYAPQTTLSQDGERLLVGWMGLPDTNYPTDNDHWAHCLTLPRVLTLKEDKLYQQPLKALEKRRITKAQFKLEADALEIDRGEVYELIVEVEENHSEIICIDLRVSADEYTRIKYDSQRQLLSLDRTSSGQLPTNVDGTVRTVALNQALYKLQIFVDISSVEIFVNNGEEVLTSRIFPGESSDGISVSLHNGSAVLNITKYELREGL